MEGTHLCMPMRHALRMCDPQREWNLPCAFEEAESLCRAELSAAHIQCPKKALARRGKCGHSICHEGLCYFMSLEEKLVNGVQDFGCVK
eukprot:1036312-Amphidinium_carterae.1